MRRLTRRIHKAFDRNSTMKTRHSFLVLLAVLFGGLVACTPSVPGCSDGRVQALLKQLAQEEYGKRIAIAKNKREAKRRQIISDAEYARKAKDEMGSLSDAINARRSQEYVKKLTEYNTLIAYEKILYESEQAG